MGVANLGVGARDRQLWCFNIFESGAVDTGTGIDDNFKARSLYHALKSEASVMRVAWWDEQREDVGGGVFGDLRIPN